MQKKAPAYLEPNLSIMVDSQVPELPVTGHLFENNENRWMKELWPGEFTGAPMDVGRTEANRSGPKSLEAVLTYIILYKLLAWTV